ncbi:helix-turn-helix domain-containing protein [Wenxinia marina]|uniref:Putative transcriptional regulator n=1 Tax=Wenxinia marina DSM 24838 TaxID=1123501 RepID=A0A0D0QJQ7_9RHOB|nr:helix-turn-helix transcriptional regulator [Wenxinia marina]KIQ71233.1 putative transcriptional regulator [Wenxinia marina DSM 24838]GGL81417.1 hypothetical protein GCM10011392_40070 [Wenxinia marina]
MRTTFRQALIDRMARDGTRIADLASGAGVSRDTINKLLSREGASTSVENAMAIAAFYGETVEGFIGGPAGDRLAALVAQLDGTERALVEAQIRGILQHRGEVASSDPGSRTGQ